MSNWKGIIGKQYTTDTIQEYLDSQAPMTFDVKFLVLHNTAEPSLKDRPNGLSYDHILGLQSYYRDDQGWSAGPHFFCDDNGIWAFTPLTMEGVHAPGWNHESVGVETLGEYTSEEWDTDRGLCVQQNAINLFARLCKKFNLVPGPDTIRLHKEDPQTTHKGCPGDHVDKQKFIDNVTQELADLNS